jgi:hypothetical protein
MVCNKGEIVVAKKKYQVAGRVVGAKAKGIPNARVEAWDKDLLVDDQVASAVTDKDGRFKIEFDSSRFRELFFDRKPDLFFKVYINDKLAKSTEDSILWNVEAKKTEVTIEVIAAGGPKGESVMAKKPKDNGPTDDIKPNGPKLGIPKPGGPRPKDPKPKGPGPRPTGGGPKPKDGGPKPKDGGPKPKDGGPKPKDGGPKPKDGGPKPKDGGPKKNGPKDKGKGKKGKKQPWYGPGSFVSVIISRKCALELLTALTLALGFPSPPKKKKKKGKKGGKGKGGEGKGGGGKGGGGKGGGGKGGGGKGGGGKGGGGVGGKLRGGSRR